MRNIYELHFFLSKISSPYLIYDNTIPNLPLLKKKVPEFYFRGVYVVLKSFTPPPPPPEGNFLEMRPLN